MRWIDASGDLTSHSVRIDVPPSEPEGRPDETDRPIAMMWSGRARNGRDAARRARSTLRTVSSALSQIKGGPAIDNVGTWGAFEADDLTQGSFESFTLWTALAERHDGGILKRRWSLRDFHDVLTAAARHQLGTLPSLAEGGRLKVNVFTQGPGKGLQRTVDLDATLASSTSLRIVDVPEPIRLVQEVIAAALLATDPSKRISGDRKGLAATIDIPESATLRAAHRKALIANLETERSTVLAFLQEAGLGKIAASAWATAS